MEVAAIGQQRRNVGEVDPAVPWNAWQAQQVTRRDETDPMLPRNVAIGEPSGPLDDRGEPEPRARLVAVLWIGGSEARGSLVSGWPVGWGRGKFVLWRGIDKGASAGNLLLQLRLILNRTIASPLPALGAAVRHEPG
jgi:hypothetical protein